MKNPKGLIITILIVAAPIIWLCIRINSINGSYNASGDEYKETESMINEIIDEQTNGITDVEPSGEVVANDSGESKSSIYGNPTSKLIDGAKINAAQANIYSEPDESSSIVASVYKDTVVTVQDYEGGWSNVKTGDLSGWIRTEFVTKPNEGSLTTAVGHKGKIKASTLNVRATGSATANVVDQLNEGEEVNIIGATDDESWLEIQYGTKTGWISGNKDYVEIKD